MVYTYTVGPHVGRVHVSHVHVHVSAPQLQVLVQHTVNAFWCCRLAVLHPTYIREEHRLRSLHTRPSHRITSTNHTARPHHHGCAFPVAILRNAHLESHWNESNMPSGDCYWWESSVIFSAQSSHVLQPVSGCSRSIECGRRESQLDHAVTHTCGHLLHSQTGRPAASAARGCQDKQG